MSTKGIFVCLAAATALLVLGWLSIQPSNDRTWATDQTVLSTADIRGDLVTVHNVRNFTYTSKSDYTPAYYDKTYDLDAIERVWYIVEPFSGFPGAAHTFLSFEFAGNNFLAISVEIRKEKGETFSPLSGVLKRYELMYVAGDERDLVKLRSNYRHDEVFVYPGRASKDAVRTLFLSMISRMNTLAQKPEFYNTVLNNCTTNIARHINAISPGAVPISPELVFPAESDRLAYDIGLIDTDLSFEQARVRYHINERALRYADSVDFSARIRKIGD